MEKDKKTAGKTATSDSDLMKLSIIKDYLTDDYNRRNKETQLQCCIRTLSNNLIFLLKKNEPHDGYDLNQCLYELTYVLQVFEDLLDETEKIRLGTM